MIVTRQLLTTEFSQLTFISCWSSWNVCRQVFLGRPLLLVSPSGSGTWGTQRMASLAGLVYGSRSMCPACIILLVLIMFDRSFITNSSFLLWAVKYLTVTLVQNKKMTVFACAYLLNYLFQPLGCQNPVKVTLLYAVVLAVMPNPYQSTKYRSSCAECWFAISNGRHLRRLQTAAKSVFLNVHESLLAILSCPLSRRWKTVQAIYSTVALTGLREL